MRIRPCCTHPSSVRRPQQFLSQVPADVAASFSHPPRRCAGGGGAGVGRVGPRGPRGFVGLGGAGGRLGGACGLGTFSAAVAGPAAPAAPRPAVSGARTPCVAGHMGTVAAVAGRGGAEPGCLWSPEADLGAPTTRRLYGSNAPVSTKCDVVSNPRISRPTP